MVTSSISIGILTFHDGINHGGYLQAYSTYRFLLGEGYKVEIINYKNSTHTLHELKNLFWKKGVREIFSNLNKIAAFKRDQDAMKLGSKRYNIKHCKTNYDAIVIGADIVWNYEWRFLGQDPVYFGEGLQAKNLIAFSPSIGKVDGLKADIPAFVKKGIERFDNISVRDDNTADLVERVTGLRPKVTLDPAFLWRPFGEEKEISTNEDFIVVYAYKLRQSDIDQIRNFAKTKDMKIFALSYRHDWADKNIVNLGPFEWLDYFKKAKYILSGTFHGTLYSLIYRKNFITSNNVGISNKTKTILSKINLMSRLTEGENNFQELFEHGIDYMSVNPKLNSLEEYSKNLLLEFVKNAVERD